MTSPLQELAQRAEKILHEEITNAKLNPSFYHIYAYDIKTVGVQGDERTYEHPVEIDVDTYEAFEKLYSLPEVLAKISTRITNELLGVNHVTINIPRQRT